MDYLDPEKRRRHTIILYLGYVLLGIAITIVTTVLLYQAYGFGIDRKGTVIQNGLVFFSSQPRPADIYINDKIEKSRTNTRLVLPESIYKVSIRRDGYQDWNRSITINGSEVVHYDYPLLIPKKLASKTVGSSYDVAPGLVTQSPDRRWLLVAPGGSLSTFDVYDLKNFIRPPVSIALPASLATATQGTQSWQLSEWADDNQHFIIQHAYDGRIEYLLIDRQNPETSVNLTDVLNLPSSLSIKISLIDRQSDQYYVFDSANKTLGKATLKNPVVTSVLTNVLNYQSYGSTVLLYATDVGTDPGKTRIRLQDGARGYGIRTVSASPTYLLDITKYSGTFYALVGGSADNKAYLYKDPAGQIGTDFFKSAAPMQVLRVDQPNYVSFSSSAQFVMVENGSQFAVYDIENKHGFKYTATEAPDEANAHANWMDGNRLSYVSAGKHIIFDYDYLNKHSLGAAVATFMPVFAPDYKYSYTISTTTAAGDKPQFNLNQTGLLIPSEL